MSWIVDSGATDHITLYLHLFSTYSPVTQHCFITMPNGRQVQVYRIGTIALRKDIIMKEVLHLPNFHFNFLSASKLAKHLSSYVVFSPDLCYIQDPLKNRQVVLVKRMMVSILWILIQNFRARLFVFSNQFFQLLVCLCLRCGIADWDTLLLNI